MTEEGDAAICTSDIFTDMYSTCGKKIGATCWTWSVCPTGPAGPGTPLFEYDDNPFYFNDDTANQIELDSSMDWYGGWGSFGMGVDYIEDEISFDAYIP